MSLDGVYIVTRWIHFSALYLMFGISIYVECLTPGAFRPASRSRTRLMLHGCTIVACVCAGVLLCLQAGQMGNGWPDAFDPSTWLAVLGTSFGRVWRWQLGLSGLALLCVLTGLGRQRHGILPVLSTLMLLCMAFVGHAASHKGYVNAIAGVNQAVHLFSGAYWLGCLIPLLWTMAYLKTAHRQDVIRTHIRFSSIGHFAVIAVVVSGLVNIGLVLGAWPLQWSSIYQRLLLVKIMLVGLMTLLALVNRYVLVPRMNSDSTNAVNMFARLVGVEIALGLGVLGLVSWFATLEPV
ncbi:copper homeostasis membrane protein CopD [Paralcaligenes ginsengisoli]